MFTGLIESVGCVDEVARGASSCIHLHVRTPLGAEMRVGESLSVNGVCLTVVAADAGAVRADIGPETAAITNLGSLSVGQLVNLERAMRADGRFGGHVVQGHVDATAEVTAIRDDGDVHWLTVAYPPAVAACIILKGSIAVEGVSLTVAALRADEFDVMVIPFTWDHTNLHALRVRDRVNLECDLIGKYVARAAQVALEGE